MNFTFNITPEISVKTSVSGTARDVAQLTVYAGSMESWSATVMQTSPTAQTKEDIISGDSTLFANATFTLTIPTSLQKGHVDLSCEVKSGANPRHPFSATVASWPLANSD